MTTDVLSQPKIDIHRSITEKILAAIEAGAGEYRMPWHRSDRSISRPVNASTEMPYRGINVVALWVEGLQRGFPSGSWATYRQWRKLGGQVRKGERGSLIVFYKEAEPEPAQADDTEADPKPRLIARASWVFNAAQVDGWAAPQRPQQNEVEAIEHVERFVSGLGADIRHGGEEACYHPVGDYVEIPDQALFRSTDYSSPTESYYSVLLHELTHWTGADSRLCRDLRSRFGSEHYAMEELIAELGAAFLCADLGITNEPRPDHAAYVADWLTVLDRDKKALFTAASKASAAVEYLCKTADATPGPAGVR